MRYHLNVGTGFFALLLLIATSLFLAITVSARKRHRRATAELVRAHQAELETAFQLGAEAGARRHQH